MERHTMVLAWESRSDLAVRCGVEAEQEIEAHHCLRVAHGDVLRATEPGREGVGLPCRARGRPEGDGSAASEDLGGVSADEAIRRLLVEHWQMKAIAALDTYRATDPEGWAEYVAEADREDGASAPAADPWDEAA
jgi:hypothetical protein